MKCVILMCRILSVIALLSGMNLDTIAQPKFDLSAGIGYYELTHLDVAWKYSSKSSIGLYAGSNFHANEKKLNCFGLSFTQIYLKPLVWKIQPGFSVKSQYWTQDDENYNLSNVAVLFQALLAYPFSDRLSLNVEAGGILNSTLETDRKQNTTAGYPVRCNGNVSFAVRYRLAKASKSL